MEIRITKTVEVKGLGKAIARVRHQRRWEGTTQLELCKQAGIKPCTWNRIENEDYPVPLETLEKIVDALGDRELRKVCDRFKQ
jgi:transcriptional regulator with XRE-family HTH domain